MPSRRVPSKKYLLSVVKQLNVLEEANKGHMLRPFTVF
jgi:hypothetical protein